ncbi:MAG TPA: DinB family protein [Anaerolineales bacterium]|nr:DinB family protein [Anaerolineales bacterium]
MNKQDILILYQYNAWSTAKILDASSNVTQGQFLAPAPFPHGSLRGTLVHALFSEWVWCDRWEGIPPTVKMKPEEFPTLESLRARWADEETRLMKFVADLTEVRLHSKIKYVSTEGNPHERVVWETMAHLINHGTQHKTEAAAILTGIGHSPGDIDLIVYLNDGV